VHLIQEELIDESRRLRHHPDRARSSVRRFPTAFSGGGCGAAAQDREL